MADSTDTAQTSTEGDGPESSDKPPLADISTKPSSSHSSSTSTPTPAKQQQRVNGSSMNNSRRSPSKQHNNSAVPSGAPLSPAQNGHIPLPPPDSNSFNKAPGHTRRSLEELHKLEKLELSGTNHPLTKPDSFNSGSMTPSSSESPSSSDDGESWSVPSTQPPSRAASMSAGISGGKVAAPSATQPASSSSKKGGSRPPSAAPPLTPTSSAGDHNATSSRSKGPPSVHSDSGQKFTLKDLLGTPKLVRRASMRSNGSSKKSDSDRGGRSTAGESTVSLLKKYGVCEKVAIGKGATSVVRLAHKWDRSEEKLYAVKV